MQTRRRLASESKEIMRVLVVDSRSASRDALSQLLTADGYEVAFAAALDQVGAAIQISAPHVMLVDYSDLFVHPQPLTYLIPYCHQFHLIVLGTPAGLHFAIPELPFESIEKPVDYPALLRRLASLQP